MQQKTWLGVTVAAAVMAVAIVWAGWPLGVPGEWTWSAIDYSAVSLVAALVIVVCGAGLVLLVDRTAARFATAPRLQSSLMAAGLVAAAFVWYSVCREPVDWLKVPAGRARDPWVLYSPGASGYFTAARGITDRREFLSGYADFVAEGDFLHQGTHPPGLVLAYWRISSLVDSVPMLESVADGLMSQRVSDGLDIISETQAQPLTSRERAVLWWAAVLTQFSAALCVVPLLYLLSLVTTREAAWRLASLWLFVPATGVFLPKSDCLYAFVGLTTGALWVKGLAGRRMIASFFAGVVASYGLMLSLAIGPLLAGVAGASFFWVARNGKDLKVLASHTSAAIAGGLVQLVPAVLGGLNIVAVWMGNLKNHATFYDHNPRTYLAWLPVNLLEGVIAVGLPIVTAGILLWLARRREVEAVAVEEDAAARFVVNVTIAILIAWAVLWLWGKNMGEAARLWVLFLSWPIVLLGARWKYAPERAWRPLAFAAVVVFAATLIRVDGFDLAGRGIGL